jgi:hypothetical protein
MSLRVYFRPYAHSNIRVEFEVDVSHWGDNGSWDSPPSDMEYHVESIIIVDEYGGEPYPSGKAFKVEDIRNKDFRRRVEEYMKNHLYDDILAAGDEEEASDFVQPDRSEYYLYGLRGI